MRTAIEKLVERIDKCEIPDWVPWRERGWNEGTTLLFLISLLSWLRIQGQEGKIEPRSIPPEIDLPERMKPAISTLINTTPKLSEILEFADYQVRFRDSVSPEEQMQICRYVATNFQGVLNS